MTTPYPFQLEDANRMAFELKGRALYAAEMGLGKSYGSLLVAHKLNSYPIIVVCPASLKWIWEEQARQHFNLRSVILSTTKPQKNLWQTVPPVIIINYEILKYWLDFLKEVNAPMVIFDECHMISNHTAKRSKSAKKLCIGVPYVLGLSGTPILNRPIELWHPLSIIKPTLFPNRFKFGVDFCGGRRMPWGSWDFSRATNSGKLHRLLLQNAMVRRKKEDVLTQLPPKQRIVIPLDIQHRSSYNHAVNDFRSWMMKHVPGKLQGPGRAEALVKLGYLKRLAARLKMKAVYEWIDNFLAESDGKIILFAVHKKIIKRLMNRYGGIATKVDGSVVGKDRKLAFTKFLTHKKTRVFVGNIKAAGVGWSAKGVSDVAFIELPWTPGEVVQGEDRCHGLNRGVEGQHSCIRYLVANDTVESKLAQLIQTKAKTISAVLDGSQTTGKLDIFNLLMKELKDAPLCKRN